MAEHSPRFAETFDGMKGMASTRASCSVLPVPGLP